MTSNTLPIYKEWLKTASKEAIAFVDQVYALCEKNYDRGGDMVVECMEPNEILEEYQTLEDVKIGIGAQIEKALNQRWGEDDDPQLKMSQRFDEGWE